MALAAAAVVVLSGCALTYIDGLGNQHAIGLIDITIRAPASPESLAGNVVEITSLGISIGQTAQGGYLTAGYNREANAALRDNALVLGNPLLALAPAPAPAPVALKSAAQ